MHTLGLSQTWPNTLNRPTVGTVCILHTTKSVVDTIFMRFNYIVQTPKPGSLGGAFKALRHIST